MKTGNRRREDLFRFLAENYVFFTVMNLVILTGIYLVLSAYGKHVAPTPDAAGLLEALSDVSDQELGRLQVSAWLGRDFGFLVLDGEGNVLCRQGDAGDSSFPEETLACIPDYYADSRVLAAELPEGGYLLTRAAYLEDESLAITGYAFLDENRAWKSGTILERESPFTAEELEYLMGRDGQGRSIYRHSYENPEGLFRQAVFWMRGSGF